jgi:hypothetical protein
MNSEVDQVEDITMHPRIEEQYLDSSTGKIRHVDQDCPTANMTEDITSVSNTCAIDIQ